MAEATVERSIYRTRSFRLAEFWCPPDSPRWRTPNVIPDTAHIAFPRTSAIIRHVGAEPVLANANHVMFYNPGQRYLRGLHHTEGDRCWFAEVAPRLLEEMIQPGEFAFA